MSSNRSNSGWKKVTVKTIKVEISDAETSECFKLLSDGKEITIRSILKVAQDLGQDISPEEAIGMLEYMVTNAGAVELNENGLKTLIHHLQEEQKQRK